MTENPSHDDDLTVEESESEAVVGGRWVEVACTDEGTEYRNSKTGKIRVVKVDKTR